MRKVPGVRSVLASVGSGFFGGLNSANFFVQLAPHEERTFGWKRLFNGRRGARFQGNYTQARSPTGDPPAAQQDSRHPGFLCAIPRRLSGRAELRH